MVRASLRLYVSRRVGRLRFGTSFGPRDFQRARAEARPERALSRDFVYVIQGHEAVKIGVTRDLASRLSTLQTGSSHPLSIAYSTRVRGDAYAVEAETHVMLARHRISGEWFAVPADVAVAAINGAAFRLSGFAESRRSGLSLRIWWPRLLAWLVLGFAFWSTAIIAHEIVAITAPFLLCVLIAVSSNTSPGSRSYGAFIAASGWMLALIPALMVLRS